MDVLFYDHCAGCFNMVRVLYKQETIMNCSQCTDSSQSVSSQSLAFIFELLNLLFLPTGLSWTAATRSLNSE